jgi:hypothetical protein
VVLVVLPVCVYLSCECEGGFHYVGRPSKQTDRSR